MLFSSTEFLYLFLPLVIILYYLVRLLPVKVSVPLKNTVLLAASLFFYAWGERWFVYVMIGSIILNYIFGLLIHFAKQKERKALARLWLILGVVCNLSLLFVYKYLTFTLTSVKSLFSLSFAVPEIALPIGISFFTFQSLSYVMDVYMDRATVQKNPAYLALYVSLFPQLIAGPIVRYETVAEQICHRRETWERFHTGFCRFVVGLAKKVMISNQMGLVADKAFEFNTLGTLNTPMAWLGALAYSLQIYYDFSGYSDMAIGLGKMFGFDFEENFNYPYISTSVTEFWRRWHISLGTWFRDYVYFPMGGSRVKSKARLVFNLAVVWSLTGIWHGAAWNFLYWGLIYFVLLTIEKLMLGDKLKEMGKLPFYKRIPGFIYTMFAVMLGWVLFRAENISLASDFAGVMFGIGQGGAGDTTALLMLTQKAVFFAAAILFSAPIAPFIRKKVEACRQNERLAMLSVIADAVYPVTITALFIVCSAYLLKSDYNPFIYFKF